MSETSVLAAPAPRSLTGRLSGNALAPTANIVVLFLVLQVIWQLALLVPGTGSIRGVIRSAAFGCSLLFLFVLPPRSDRHPAARAIILVLGIIGLSVLHPTTNNVIAGLAHVVLYLAIVAPLWWVAGLRVDERGFRRVMLVIWGFHTLSCLVGVLQIYFPGYFVPDVEAMYSFQRKDYRDSFRFVLASGERIWRPLGLLDWPGGAGNSGMYVVLFALGLMLTDRRPLPTLLYLGSIAAALFCIWMCQIRSLQIMTAISLVAFVGILLCRGDVFRLLRVGLPVGVLVVGAFFWAAAVGGRSVLSRLETLIERDPTEVYYRNRGHFLERTLNEYVPEYPLGAGLGRWGMIHNYFGDNTDPERGPLWAEIQWTGWVFDGGIPLVLAYSLAAGLACWLTLRTAVRRASGDLGLWAAVLFAYNIGALALTFNYPVFLGQAGLEFWLLNATLFAALQGANVAANPREQPLSA